MQLRSFRLLPLGLLLASCGGGGSDGGGPTPVLEVVKWTPSGDNQTDTVGQTLPNVIRVKVSLDDAVTAGVTVTFSGGALGTPSMVTGSNGIATTTWTLNEVAGPQQVTASVAGAVGSPLTFNATAVPGPAVQLKKVSGDGQASDTSQIFGAAFSVRIVDAFENGIPGRWVQWSKSGPITLATDSIITDANGFSNMFATAGTSGGAVTVTATATGLTGSPIGFTGAVVAAPTIVQIGNNFFNPATLNISAGSAVKWVWGGQNHSVSSTGVPSFTGSDIRSAPSEFGPVLFSTPGVYQYECAVHATMQGTITVN